MPGWIVLLVILVIVSIFTSTYALPRIYLSLRYKIDKSNDRCIKRVYEKHGQSLVYEPEEKWRDYINQYILSERKEKKELVCKIDKNLSYIEYDVIVFNCYNKIINVISAKEYVDEKGYTSPLEMPEDTAFVSIKVSRADNKEFKGEIVAKVSAWKTFEYILVSSFAVILEVFAIKICLANIFGGVFRESFILNSKGLIISLVMGIILVAINVLVVFLDVKSREKKFLVKVEKDA